MLVWVRRSVDHNGRDPFNQNFRKFRSKTQWIGSVQPEKFRKNGSTFWGGPIFPVGPVGILVEWIAPKDTEIVRCRLHSPFGKLEWGFLTGDEYFLRDDLRLSFLGKYCIQSLFVENVTALIKMWWFLAGVSSPLVENKGEAEAGALYASRCDIFEKTFRCLRPKKGWCRSRCLKREKT